MNIDNEYKAILQEFEAEEAIERPETRLTGVEGDEIPAIIDIGYYTSPRYWGKNTDSDNDTLQFMINMATFEANNISISDTGTIFERWNITQGNAGYIDNEARKHIRRAICLITDVFENSDYDRTKGSYSFTLPGMSVSQSTSENNLVIPQAAINELIAAGFLLAPYATDITDKANDCITQVDTDFWGPGNEELCTPISIATGDVRYVRQLQPNSLKGSIATINERHMVEFKLIADIIENEDIRLEKAKTILDPLTGEYKPINAFNVNYFGGWTIEQITNAIIASNTRYNPDYDYKMGFIILDIRPDGTFGWYESIKEPNKGHPPATSPEYWRELPSAPVDINLIVEQLKPFIVEEVSNEVSSQLSALSTIEYISEGLGEVIIFNTAGDYETYKNNMEVDNSYFETLNLSLVQTDQVNTYTQTQKFDRIIEMGQPSGDQAYILPRKNDGKTILRLGNSPGNNNKRFDVNLEDRSYIFNSPDPNQPQDVANKRYVDNAKTSAINESRSYTDTKSTDALNSAKSFTTMELNNYYNKTLSDSRYARKPVYFKSWNITYSNRAGEDQADGGKIRFYKWRLDGISAVKFDALVWNFETFGDERYHTWSVSLDSTNNNQAWLYITCLTPWTDIRATLKLYSID